MLCDIITIGDEILIGQVVDTNSAFIASELNAIGITIRQIVSVSDNEQAISEALKHAIDSSDVIIITGGLGPTNDDITKKTLAKFFNSKLVRNSEVEKYLENLFERREWQLSELNRAQADLPDNCILFPNRNGTAAGMLFQTSAKKTVISLPGVPFEMKSLIIEEVIPWLKQHYKMPYRQQKTFLTTGIPESTMAERLTGFEAQLPEMVSLAYLPSPGLLRLRLSISGLYEEQLKSEFNKQCSLLEAELGNDLFGYDEDSLEACVGRLLKSSGLTLCTAESCTGGNIARMITSVSGASDYFTGSIVAYSNRIKSEVLKVSPDLLHEFGAVSQQVVIKMAEGAKNIFGSDFAIATSGIAGPSGGTVEKPVGTVWIAVASPIGTFANKLQLGEHRGRTIVRSSLAALNILRLEIAKNVKKTK